MGGSCSVRTEVISVPLYFIRTVEIKKFMLKLYTTLSYRCNKFLLVFLSRRVLFCLFFTHFHTIAPISFKFGMVVEDLFMEVLDN